MLSSARTLSLPPHWPRNRQDDIHEVLTKLQSRITPNGGFPWRVDINTIRRVPRLLLLCTSQPRCALLRRIWVGLSTEAIIGRTAYQRRHAGLNMSRVHQATVLILMGFMT